MVGELESPHSTVIGQSDLGSPHRAVTERCEKLRSPHGAVSGHTDELGSPPGVVTGNLAALGSPYVAVTGCSEELCSPLGVVTDGSERLGSPRIMVTVAGTGSSAVEDTWLELLAASVESGVELMTGVEEFLPVLLECWLSVGWP